MPKFQNIRATTSICANLLNKLLPKLSMYLRIIAHTHDDYFNLRTKTEIYYCYYYFSVWKLDPDAVDEESIRIKEQGIMQLGELYKKEKKAKGNINLNKSPARL